MNIVTSVSILNSCPKIMFLRENTKQIDSFSSYVAITRATYTSAKSYNITHHTHDSLISIKRNRKQKNTHDMLRCSGQVSIQLSRPHIGISNRFVYNYSSHSSSFTIYFEIFFKPKDKSRSRLGLLISDYHHEI